MKSIRDSIVMAYLSSSSSSHVCISIPSVVNIDKKCTQEWTKSPKKAPSSQPSMTKKCQRTLSASSTYLSIITSQKYTNTQYNPSQALPPPKSQLRLPLLDRSPTPTSLAAATPGRPPTAPRRLLSRCRRRSRCRRMHHALLLAHLLG